MKKFNLLFPIGIIFFAVWSISFFHIQAATTSDLEAEINRVKQDRQALLEEQQKLQAELDKVNREGQTLGAAVKSLDAAKKKLAADINVTKSRINSANLNIQSLESTMTKNERQIATHKEAIKETLLLLSNYDSRPLILDLLAAANLSDIWNDRTNISELNSKLDEEIDNLRESKKVLSKQKEEKQKVVKEQLSLATELSGQKLVVEENQKAKQVLLAETKNKEAEYQRLIQENIARQKQSESDLYRLEQELRITLDPTLFPESRPGILSWPLKSVTVTGLFGRSDCGIYGGPDCFHNGLDLRASMGTPVYAMLEGTVEGTGNTDDQKGCYSYGRWILVRHKNGLSSIYAHLSGAVVKKGDIVETGQLLGYSGGVPGVNGSGYSKGAHLHVGLLASQGVEIRQFTTSIGCKQVFVPIAKGREAYLDPLSYLPKI